METNGRPYTDCNSLVSANVARQIKPLSRNMNDRMDKIENKQDQTIELIKEMKSGKVHTFVTYVILTILGLSMLLLHSCGRLI